MTIIERLRARRITRLGGTNYARDPLCDEAADLLDEAVKALEDAEFLCARLRELECDILDDEVGRQYYGHVSPARARLESALDETLSRIRAENGTITKNSPLDFGEQ